MADEGLTPALRCRSPAWRSAPRAYAYAWGVRAHLVLGLALTAVTETAWALYDRRP